MTQDEINKAFENRWRIKGNFGQMNQNAATMSFDEYFEYIKGMCKDFFEAGIVLGGGVQPRPVYITDAKDFAIKQRAEVFYKSLNTREFIGKYGMQMLQDFYDYWTEPNPSNTKMRFELQKTWDVNRRLARWARNNFNRYDRQQPTIELQRKSKLADILTD